MDDAWIFLKNHGIPKDRDAMAEQAWNMTATIPRQYE